MKRLTAVLMILCLLAAGCASADSVRATLRQRIATRTGPGTKYTEPGSFLKEGATVTVHTKVWDHANEIWWVQTEFTYSGRSYRAYTGSWRMNVDLTRVPEERPLETVSVTRSTSVYAGPGSGYASWRDSVSRGTTATLIEVENGYGHIECWNSREGKPWRVWAPLDCLSCSGRYDRWDDTYPDWGYSSGWEEDSWMQPIGSTCHIVVSSGNARLGPGVEYPLEGYVHEGEWYIILDTAKASNGVTWYMILLDDICCWISSGLTSTGMW